MHLNSQKKEKKKKRKEEKVMLLSLKKEKKLKCNAFLSKSVMLCNIPKHIVFFHKLYIKGKKCDTSFLPFFSLLMLVVFLHSLFPHFFPFLSSIVPQFKIGGKKIKHMAHNDCWIVKLNTKGGKEILYSFINHHHMQNRDYRKFLI